MTQCPACGGDVSLINGEPFTRQITKERVELETRAHIAEIVKSAIRIIDKTPKLNNPAKLSILMELHTYLTTGKPRGQVFEIVEMEGKECP